MREILPGQRLRDGGRRRRAAGACRSTRRTACTARPATSRIRTKSSTGPRPKAAPDPTISRYEHSLEALCRTGSGLQHQPLHPLRERAALGRAHGLRFAVRLVDRAAGRILARDCPLCRRARRSGATGRSSRTRPACPEHGSSRGRVSTSPKTCCASATSRLRSCFATSAARDARSLTSNCTVRSRASPPA